ncbi:hypothetical protein M9458_054955, partial [Cirrhinus mrigala]
EKPLRVFAQRVTVITGVRTAAAAVSVRTRRCVTPSPEPASVRPGTAAGAARTPANATPTATTANRNACARTTPRATTSPESASAAQGTREPCKFARVPRVRSEAAVRHSLKPVFGVCVQLRGPVPSRETRAAVGRCVDSRVRRDASGRTAHRSVSVIMEEAVRRPPASACAAQDTQERGRACAPQLNFSAGDVSGADLSRHEEHVLCETHGLDGVSTLQIHHELMQMSYCWSPEERPVLSSGSKAEGQADQESCCSHWDWPGPCRLREEESDLQITAITVMVNASKLMEMFSDKAITRLQKSDETTVTKLLDSCSEELKCCLV